VSAARLDELFDLLRIPSVSADAAHAGDVRRAGAWVRDLVATAKGGRAELVETDAQPLVIGEIRASRDADRAPTVLAYGHFDVQPPAPLELWDSDPFEPAIAGEWLVARGVADDKGQLHALLRAAFDLAAEESLPVNVRVAADGEEETGGTSIVDWVLADERGADVCVIFDSGMERRDAPVFCTGTRGLLDFELTVRTGVRDLHSGMYGNAALNAIHALAEALAGILPRDGRLPEPLREGIVPVSDDERHGWSSLPSGADVLGAAGATPYDERAADEFWLRTTSESSVDVNGILGGKPGLRNTTTVTSARANFTVRLAPGQDVETIRAAAERLLREAAPAGAELELGFHGGAPAALVDPKAPAIRLAMRAFAPVFGREPLLVRTGGTLPIMAALSERRIPVVLTGVALPESNVHSPNEKLPVAYLAKAYEAARALCVGFGELPARAGQRRFGANL
jgi:acetylornithine deacetylase/succinyl-diaminopimelate desuccinylase-like protein